LQTERLLKLIEELRQELHELVEEKEDLINGEVIDKSQEIDRLLNEYMELIKKKS